MSAVQRGAALVLILAALVGYAVHEARQTGRAEGRAEVAAERVGVLTRYVAVTDTVYRDSLRVLTRWRTEWDSVRVTDTITITRDSIAVVYVPRETADSVVSACYAVLRSCDARVAARDSLIISLRASIPRPPSRLRVWGERALFLGAGVGIRSLVRR